MARRIGAKLNQELDIGALHALYRENGRWYHHLERFPGVLFEAHGYIIFETRKAYENCSQLRHGEKLNVTGGISSIPGYVQEPRIAKILAQLPN